MPDTSDQELEKKKQLQIRRMHLREAIDRVINKLNFAAASISRAKRDSQMFPPFMKMHQGNLNSAGLDINHAKREWDDIIQKYADLCDQVKIQGINRLFDNIRNPDLNDTTSIYELENILRNLKR